MMEVDGYVDVGIQNYTFRNGEESREAKMLLASGISSYCYISKNSVKSAALK